MSSSRVAALLLLAIALSSTACSDGGSRSSLRPPLMPLTTGNTWEYEFYTVSAGDTSLVDTTRIAITGTVSPGGRRYYATNSDLVFANVEGGLSVAVYDAPGDSLKDFECLLRYPISGGTSYPYDSPPVAARDPGIRGGAGPARAMI